MIISLNIDPTFERHLISALGELAGERQWKISRYTDGRHELEWNHENTLDPIDYEIVFQKAKEHETIWQNTEYQRLRKPEYPAIVDFADAYYWMQQGDNTKMDEYLEKITAIKDKYPKVNNAS